MQNDQSQNSIWQTLQHVPAVLIVISLLYRFFDQSARYHDEIINVAKGATADIFNYALRPAFYGVDALSVSLFGNSTLALSFSSYIAFAALSLVTYQYLRRYQGTVCALVGVAALAWAGWIYPLGIRGMPHLYPILFLTIAIYCYHRQADGPGDRDGSWSFQWSVAALLWMALLSHPTAIALLVGFFSMVALDLVWDKAWKAPVGIVRVAASWLVPLLCFWIITEILYHVYASGHHSYIGYWIEVLGKTSSSDYSRYFKPYGFYFHLVLMKLMPLCVLFSICVAVATAGSLVGRWRNRRVTPLETDGMRRAVGLLVAALVSLCVVSLEKWKFDRVLVTFLPLTSLALVYSIFQMVRRAPRFGGMLRTLVMVVVVISSFATFLHDARGASEYFAKRYPTYSGSFDVIRHLPVKRIAYVGKTRNMDKAKYQTDAAGKSLVVEDLSKGDLSDGESIVRALVAKGYRYVVLDVVGNNRTAQRFRKFAHEAGLTRKAIIHSRSTSELWELAPSYLGEDVADRLADLPRSKRVAILVDRRSELWLLWTLQDGGYRPRFLREVPTVSSIKNFSVVFVGNRYSSQTPVRDVLSGAQFRHVGGVSNHMTTGHGIEMWVRQ